MSDVMRLGGRVPPSGEWRRKVLVAPGLASLGVLLLIGTAVQENSHGHRASALCHHVPLPWTMFVLAWAALASGVAALVVCALLFRSAARDMRSGVESWQGTLALCICVGSVLAVLFEAVAVYGVHAEAGQAYWNCAGAASLLGAAG